MHARLAAHVGLLAATLFSCGSGEGGGGDPPTTSPTTASDHPAQDDETTSASAVQDGPELPWTAHPFPAAPTPDDNATTDEKVVLGRLLFYDPIVSVDGMVACATCHSEVWGMSDALPRSIGHGADLMAGPGREGPNVTRRNSQTLWNVAFRDELFWDGRSTSLEEQALFPFEAVEELNRDPGVVIAELDAIDRYRTLFAAAFPSEDAAVTVDNFAKALAAFQRTLITNRSLYDSFSAGDAGAMSDEMRRGMFAFAEAGCDDCHTPPLFESERYAHRDVAPLDGVEDAGRFEVTGDEPDRGSFKVPTLRNLRETGPYFHTGAVTSLEDAVAHEVRVSVEHGEAPEISAEDVAAIATFLEKALVDHTREPKRPETVPSGLPVPLDDTRLLR